MDALIEELEQRRAVVVTLMMEGEDGFDFSWMAALAEVQMALMAVRELRGKS